MRGKQRNTIKPHFLTGWKDIASYLGKGVRTVQRYEGELGLPVRRPAGKPRGSVVATKAELDAWVAASPIREVLHLAKPGTDMRIGFATHALRSGISEMRRLRDETSALEAELRESLQVLRESVLGITGELTEQNRVRPGVYGLLDRNMALDLLSKAVPRKVT
jgi:hypothetical protein